jgi:hypothetical protein
MKRDRISFEDFKNSFIAQPDGYFPVYSCLDEDYEGEPLRVFRLDMICEWRLTDGKVKFLEVPFDTKEQFDEMVAYLRVATDLLNKAIVEQIGELTYKDSKQESEAIPYPPSDWPKLSDEVMDDIREKTKNFNLALIADAMGYQRQ